MSDYTSIRKLFNDYKCAILSNQKSLDSGNIHFVCSCGKEDYISLDEFQKNHTCNACDDTIKKRLTHAYVNQQFEIYGCELTSEYKGYDEKLSYKCICGDVIITTFNIFIHKHNKKCRKCYNNGLREKFKLDYETVKRRYVDNGCILISKEYINCDSIMEFMCRCGRIGKKSFDSFSRNPNCRACGHEMIGEKLKLSYDEVNRYFKSHGCKLLSNIYINCDTKLEYVCICGNIGWTSFDRFKRLGVRCGCIKKSKGETLIAEILDKLDIDYDRQCTFDNCKNIHRLPFDFSVVYDNYTFLIEFDGKQHFQSIKLFGGEKDFKERVKHDNIKNRYCITNKIPILRISCYREFKHIELIISLYISMLKANVNPPIMFTNRNLYENQHNAVKDLIYRPALKRPTVIDKLYDNTVEISYRNVFMPIQ